jgi:carboxyl-terminal processing protease
MRLYEFADGTDAQVQQALVGFEQQGVQGWVLDLRDNPGGIVDIFARIASRFVAGGKPLGYAIGRDGQAQPIDSDPALFFTPQRPLAVLINGGSASSSEAFAAAAQDLGFAHLVGETTAGCLAEAQTFPLADGSALEITVQQFVSPQKRQINQVGVTPDEVVQPDPAGVGDPVLDAALQWVVSRPSAVDQTSWTAQQRGIGVGDRGQPADRAAVQSPAACRRPGSEAGRRV